MQAGRKGRHDEKDVGIESKVLGRNKQEKCKGRTLPLELSTAVYEERNMHRLHAKHHWAGRGDTQRLSRGYKTKVTKIREAS